jgi:hypothetical protein
MANYIDEARYQTVQDMAAALCEAASKVMALHGNDPKGATIIAAGFAMALRRIGTHVDVAIPHTVRELLQ